MTDSLTPDTIPASRHKKDKPTLRVILIIIMLVSPDCTVNDFSVIDSDINFSDHLPLSDISTPP